jgi:hypothetical protein
MLLWTLKTSQTMIQADLCTKSYFVNSFIYLFVTGGQTWMKPGVHRRYFHNKPLEKLEQVAIMAKFSVIFDGESEKDYDS